MSNVETMPMIVHGNFITRWIRQWDVEQKPFPELLDILQRTVPDLTLLQLCRIRAGSMEICGDSDHGLVLVETGTEQESV